MHGGHAAGDLPDFQGLYSHRSQVDGAGALALAVGFFLAVTALTVAVSDFTEGRISGWEAGTQLVRWFVVAVGVYVTAVYLPLYVTHGRTRGEVARQLAVFLPLYAVLVGVLVAAGVLLEGLVYGVADWPQALDARHLFDDPGQAHLVALEHSLVFLVWVTGGAALGAAFYRRAGASAAGLSPLPRLSGSRAPRLSTRVDGQGAVRHHRRMDELTRDAPVDLRGVPSPEEPAEALAAVVALRRLADQLESSAVRVAIRDGWTWADVADALGVTRQAAHKKHAHRLRDNEGA